MKAAKLQGHVKIVTYDWLEDSLLSKNRRPKREKPYLLETILEDELKKEKAGKKGTKGKQDDGSKSKKRKRDGMTYCVRGCDLACCTFLLTIELADTDGNGRVVKSKSRVFPCPNLDTGSILMRGSELPPIRGKGNWIEILCDTGTANNCPQLAGEIPDRGKPLHFLLPPAYISQHARGVAACSLHF